MDIIDRFEAYMAAFEATFEDDDWTRLEAFLTEEAVYEADFVARGRDVVLEKLRGSVNQFDRKMDERIPEFEAPAAEGDTVRTRWAVTYRKAGLPDLVIRGLEIAEFDGDRIARLRDEFDPEAQKAMGEWLAAHGAAIA